jgi:FkbM family methyltransferase
MLHVKRLVFFCYYSIKKYIVRRRSPWDYFWNDYYRRLSCHHHLRIIRHSRGEILVGFQQQGFPPLRGYLRIASSDPAPYMQVFIQGEYAPLIELIEKNEDVWSIQNIVDAGGNIGMTTLYLKQRFPQARILVVEPDTSNFTQVRKNIQVNAFTDIEPVQAGVWKTDTFLSITQPVGLMNQTSLVVTESASPTSLKGVTIGTLADGQGFPIIDVLKMDIEGTEAVLFRDPDFREMLVKRVSYLAHEIHASTGAAPEIHRFFDENQFSYTEASETTFAVNRNLTAQQSMPV